MANQIETNLEEELSDCDLMAVVGGNNIVDIIYSPVDKTTDSTAKNASDTVQKIFGYIDPVVVAVTGY